MNIIEKIFGSKHDRDIKKIQPTVDEINGYYEEYDSLSDEEIQAKTVEFRQRIDEGESLDDILPEAFAVVKQACKRLCGKKWDVSGFEVEWDMIPYDVQLIGGVVLHEGKIAEMATGEGKTLVATLPIYLNALSGKGVHLVTVNDYLARRDSEWMGGIYKFLGLTVGCIQNDMDNIQRREAYNCDITYGTNNEFGFDYLRDNMAQRAEDRVQRKYNYAIVDEVDSVLIDEARTPLIISGPVSVSTHRFKEMKPLVQKLVKRQTTLVNKLIAEGEKLLEQNEDYEAGIRLLGAQRGSPKNKKLLKLFKEQGVQKLVSRVEADFMREKRIHEIDEMLYFAIDEKEHSINLTEQGIGEMDARDKELFVIPDITEGLSEIEGDENLSNEEKIQKREELYRLHAERSEKNHNINQLLKAYILYERDDEYVVQDGKVMIVDEFTGRLMPGRRYSDGLHQAIEAKEGVEIERETQTLATITLQNFFRMYDKLAGMTGTAVTEAEEFYKIYKLDVVCIPTNKPVRRIDYDDNIYRTKREKYNSIIEEIVEKHEQGRPVLVGTVSVEVSETLSRMLKRQGISHSVLNAKYHQQEAEIVAKAGHVGAVTIATNMAGRGTDIKLDKQVVKSPNCKMVSNPAEGEPCPEYDNCEENVPCGLHIVGTERHESRRIDRQLRGRSGRQGDPGSSKFFLSLEDDLMRLFGSDRIAAIMDRLGVEEGEVIQHGMVTKAIEKAQKRVEAQNFSIRKHLLDYDDVMNQQRAVIYSLRAQALEGEDLSEDVQRLVEENIDAVLAQHCASDYPEEWNLLGLKEDISRLFLLNVDFKEDNLDDLDHQRVSEMLHKAAKEIYQYREKTYGTDIMRKLERYAYLSVIDERWKDHLYELDQIRQGIGLRAYGQKNPLIEYKKETFVAFEKMLNQIDREIVEFVYKIQLRKPEGDQKQTEAQPAARKKETEKQMVEVHDSAVNMGYTGMGEAAQPQQAKPQTVKREGKKVGRNDPCPCGSGKKYKKCCGK
ncbi:MAG: preprotein translocase subunit SecA [candidate division Zixibacteria bacterium]|nr:preprotein translocase subunit SecA [candidate division Zixibacteria bacterium]